MVQKMWSPRIETRLAASILPLTALLPPLLPGAGAGIDAILPALHAGLACILDSVVAAGGEEERRNQRRKEDEVCVCFHKIRM